MHQPNRTRGVSARLAFLATIVASPWLAAAAAFGQSTTPAFVAPPRTIADITAILDQEKPDPTLTAKMRAEADAAPPTGVAGRELAKFHYGRCMARAALGDFRAAIADCEKAVEIGDRSLDASELGRIRQGLAIQYASAGETKKSIQVQLRSVQMFNVKGTQGFLFNAQRQLADRYIQLGDFNQAEVYVRRNQALLVEAQGWKKFGGFRKASFECDTELGRARLLEARGQFREAEVSYRRAEGLRREALRVMDTYDGLKPPVDQMQQSIDEMIAAQGRMKARQGRVAEGEADVRRALLSRLKVAGKYNLKTVPFIGALANLLVEQGRFAEAEQLTRRQIEIQQTLGVPKDGQNYPPVLSQLASILNLQGRWEDAAKIYAEIDDATKGWDAARREALVLNSEHIATLYNTNNLDAGIAAAERLLARNKTRLGEQHVDTALSHGLLAIGFAKAKRDADALREFKLAVPILMAQSHETDDDDPTVSEARDQRTQVVVESYVALLARLGPAAGADAASESFKLIDTIRGRSVQRALTSSGARATAKNPALAELVRKEQDLEKQLGAQLGLMNNVLALPPEQRDEKALKALQGDIDRLRTARDAAKRDLAGKFRDYASLVEPAPPSAEDIRAVMRDDEAFLSFYFGRDASFVWAVPKSGPIAFVEIQLSAGEVEGTVMKLRQALEPNVAFVSEIPPFDVARAYELYAKILKPVEAGWRQSKSLIVATNGALGLLPLGLLPTEAAEVKPDGDVRFSGYRDVAWLARTHAVTLVPSAAALRTLRQLPPGSDKRERMIGFGDPIFSKEQASAAAQPSAQVAELATRGVPLVRRAAPHTEGVDSAQLSLLPRLPDTADELKSIALAMQADPSKVLNLGAAANEETVKKTDLSKYRIIVFATHGLVPGELDGLHQPALALSAPDVAGVPGDGLLTMDEILALKLDADWVVLSACNTAAGAGAGAEAASGLGRAFFYAGTRAILVTNWSVHSQSARELVSDLFARQAADGKITRSEALRAAMMALLDSPGYTDDKGKTLFSYAHPLFWAPYTIIGDGG
ncbi:MAG TPA: CHAT domain-containing protein [Xanthobacteraceae bacterium]|nr:CHAT domain-containing protein [Xanthobacteraceae bacterium]